MTVDAERRLLLIHAHPDDESINCGTTMAKYVAEGAHVTLVTCTLGEEGEVLVPGLEHLAADATDTLGRHRIGELDAAMKELGVTDWRFLGGPGRYRDSGMMGVASNERPECFWQADVDEAAAHLVEVIREVRPQVLVTQDENGAYGHPDHIQAHRVAMRGYELAADASYRPELGAPWQIDKVYWTAYPRFVAQESARRMKEAGSSFFGIEDVDDIPFVVLEERVSAGIDGMEYVEAKLAAMRAHATQIAVDGPFFALSNNVGHQVWAWEYYELVRGERGPGDGPRGHESDLFAGL